MVQQTEHFKQFKGIVIKQKMQYIKHKEKYIKHQSQIVFPWTELDFV